MTKNYKTKILRVTGLALIAVGILILLQVLYTDVYANFKQQALRDLWDKAASNHGKVLPAESTEAPSGGVATTEPPGHNNIPKRSALARIVIPKIELDAIIVEGVDEDDLKLGPGHMEETAYPGEVGNMVISGHRVTYSRPFYSLNELEKGDPIYIYETSQRYIYYVVEKRIVKPTDISVIQPTPDRTLTLTTCNPRFSAKTRLIIVAKMEAG